MTTGPERTVLLTEESRKPGETRTALFNLGFRVFFLGAGIHAVLVMILWSLVQSGLLDTAHLTLLWHAHEMIFGYALAVIAGFLLTSIQNWTGLATVNGWPLAVLAALWGISRVGNALDFGLLAAGSDLAFLVAFGVFAIVPIVRVRQWRQTAIVGIVLALMAANTVYYAGLLGYVEGGMRFGNDLGFVLVTGLILIMAGRVIPFFTERGIDGKAKASRWVWLEWLNFAAYAVFAVLFLAGEGNRALYAVSLLLCLTNTVRLAGWMLPGMWRKPLLWSLHLGYAFVPAGFALFGLLWLNLYSWFVALHALAVGAVGVITLSMMARVALGHTGRGIGSPPGTVVTAFVLLLSAALARTLLPIVFPGQYVFSVLVSQLLWIGAFSLFVWSYWPILSKPRVDGRPG